MHTRLAIALLTLSLSSVALPHTNPLAITPTTPHSSLSQPMLRLAASNEVLPSGHLPEPKPLLLFAAGFLGLAIGIHIKRQF